MDTKKGILRNFINNFEEYLCSIALIIMVIVTFVNVFSRKISWINLSFSQELVTTMFVWVCCLAAASAFKDDSHMGFSFLTDKLKNGAKRLHTLFRIIIISLNYLIWVFWGFIMVIRQYEYGLKTGVLEMPSWLIGLAIPLSGIFSIVRLLQFEYKKNKIKEVANQ
ncbi:MAG TPA: TRAP transporter small permease [Candidatus Dorea intestinavium]|nr:TRAP transporter small permease [Candidatus Dorea intestinavium]